MMFPDHNKKIFIERRRRLRRDQTDAEACLWYFLRNRRFLGFKFHRQYSVGPYILDYYCCEAKLAIELDGGQHASSVGIAYDAERTTFLEYQSIQVLRFWNHEFLQDPQAVLEVIRTRLAEP